MCSFLFMKLAAGCKLTMQDIERFNRLMMRRGPDGSQAAFIGDDMVFLHNLLHLCGDVAVQQPVVTDSGCVLLFNGEIWNWRELGVEGARCDTDVIVPMYEKHGRDFVRVLDGEFAIVLYDKSKDEVLVSTDVFMTKPMFVAKGSGGMGVASYASALVSAAERGGCGWSAKDVVMAEPNTCVVYKVGNGDEVYRTRVYDFDLRQYKTGMEDWEAAFEEAVKKRALHGGKMFLCLSSGYDSGCIALALNRLGIEYDTFSTMKGENVDVLRSRLRLGKMGGACGTCYTVEGVPDEMREACGKMVGEVCEPWTYVHDDGPDGARTVMENDGGARAMAFICSKMSDMDYRVVLSGSGADEILSDYGFGGRKIYYHSEFGGLWPEKLEGWFPWRKFYGDTQRSYLFKDEFVAGGWGIEGRYPFLDKKVVQEWLWLRSDVKNSEYKAVLASYMRKHGYPMETGRKIGFNI